MAHCGDNMGGPFVYSLVATDVCPFPSSASTPTMTVCLSTTPSPSTAPNRDIEFTRSLAYRKNDQAWVEQKNGAVIRRFLDH